MLEYRIARPEEEADILDLINLVFSQTRIPHHFDQLIPKVYAYPGYAPYHYIAVEDGKIRACVAVLPAQLHLDRDLSLQVGLGHWIVAPLLGTTCPGLGGWMLV